MIVASVSKEIPLQSTWSASTIPAVVAKQAPYFTSLPSPGNLHNEETISVSSQTRGPISLRFGVQLAVAVQSKMLNLMGEHAGLERVQNVNQKRDAGLLVRLEQ